MEKIIELYCAGIYYQENYAILWNKETGQVYWRNTWTGEEKPLGSAKKLKEARKIKEKFLEEADKRLSTF